MSDECYLGSALHARRDVFVIVASLPFRSDGPEQTLIILHDEKEETRRQNISTGLAHSSSCSSPPWLVT